MKQHREIDVTHIEIPGTSAKRRGEILKEKGDMKTISELTK
jgi:hypothetical protein